MKKDHARNFRFHRIMIRWEINFHLARLLGALFVNVNLARRRVRTHGGFFLSWFFSSKGWAAESYEKNGDEFHVKTRETITSRLPRSLWRRFHRESHNLEH